MSLVPPAGYGPLAIGPLMGRVDPDFGITCHQQPEFANDVVREEVTGQIGFGIGHCVKAMQHLDVFVADQELFRDRPRHAVKEAMMHRFGLQVFEQYSRGDRLFQDGGGTVHRGRGFALMEGSLLFAGCMGELVRALGSALPADRIMAGRPVSALCRTGDRAVAEVTGGQISAGSVVLALPPRVAAEAIGFAPALPDAALVAANAMPTWMAGQAKFVAVHNCADWREAALSGDAMSQRGPLIEIHDASPHDDGPFALFSFIGWPPDLCERPWAELLPHALLQLQTLLGPALGRPIATQIMDWASVPTVAAPRDRAGTAGHPAYSLQRDLQGLWDGRLHFGSTEAATGFGGYLEGALEAAERVASAI